MICLAIQKKKTRLKVHDQSTLEEKLKSIALNYTAEHLSDIIALATKRRLGALELLEHICEREEIERKAKSLERRLKRSKLARFKPMADFDWTWPKAIDRAAIERVLTLDFIHTGANVVLMAPQGLGKTMIAQNIAHAAVLKGYSALFISAAELLNDLAACESSRSLERRFKYYCQGLSLLCIDEVGYLNFESRSADLLFQIISRRHEKRSVVLTTNLAFSDWPSIFPNSSCTVALIDRVVEHADIIAITGDSFRRRAAQEKSKTKGTK